MAVEDILKKIESDAEEEARRIVAERKKAGDSVLDQARKKHELERERLHGRARQRAGEERNRIITLAKLAARRELLDEKQRLIGRVFDEARGAILAMDRDAYRRLIRTFLEKTVEGGEIEVIIDTDERRIDQAFLDDVAGGLAGTPRLTLAAERRSIGGGFVLRQGKTETNCALDTILRAARERLETEVAGILFPEESGS